jgi:hypothetical protein
MSFARSRKLLLPGITCFGGGVTGPLGSLFCIPPTTKALQYWQINVKIRGNQAKIRNISVTDGLKIMGQVGLVQIITNVRALLFSKLLID